MMNYTNLLGSSTKIPMLLSEFYDQWADPMEDYLNRIDEDLWRLIQKGPYRGDQLQAVSIADNAEEVIAQGNKHKANDKIPP